MVWGCACDFDIFVKSFCLYFFYIMNLVIFHPQYIDSRFLVSTTPHTILYQSFFKLCTCFLHSLKMCMCFWYNPCLNCCYFFSTLWTLSLFDLIWIDRGYLVIATPHTILYWSLWNLAHVFFRVYRSACSLDIIFEYFCHFFQFNCHFLTWDFIKVYRLWISFERKFSCIIWDSKKFLHWFLASAIYITFLGGQVRHQLHRSSIYFYYYHVLKKVRYICNQWDPRHR